ncbi:hypothetical protein SK128_021742 [Halocaridina rubra]|uniref:Tetratricopeptide repeat protein 37 n=1 Tax=Halocaridina rubra TaxID=373956 RepID=A0AAN8X0J1_HALRR
MSTEVKAALKEAKKSMKDNDYEAVMKHCKVVLKHDRKNYNGLVIFARACQELGKGADSKKALLLASQVDPESPVAWQGLKKLCDDQPNLVSQGELVTILTRLKGIYLDDEEKLDGVYRKLATIQLESGKPLDASATLKELMSVLKDSKKITEAWRSIVQILSSIKDLSKKDTGMLQEALENILSESVLGENEKNYQTYLNLLYRTRQMKKLVFGAQAMLTVFPTYFPLEWLCRAFVETTADPIEGEENFALSMEQINEYISKLLSMNNASPWGNLAQGVIYQQNKQFVEAKAHLRVGAEHVPNSLLGWKLLLNVNKDTNNWPGVEVTCKKMLDILSTTPKVSIPGREEREAFIWKLKLMRADAFIHMGHENHLREAVSILEEQEDMDLDIGAMLIRSLIKLGVLDSAAKKLDGLRAALGEQPHLTLLFAVLTKAKGETQKSLELFELFVKENPSVGEGHLELGRLYYETGNLQKAYISCMRAGKLDPTLCHAFLYLGHFFRYQDNMERALKCYEKAMNINPCDDETGAALSDLYRILGKHEENLALLRKITNEAGRSSCAWAWLRLGLHHYVLNELTESILAFQYSLTINPKDGAGYECLGDALLARGAHTAALKVFKHAAELRPNAVYPLYQIAHLKQIVGENLEAIADYEAVLKRHPIPAVEVVSLIGLAEALIASARKHYEQFFHVNMKEACVRAIGLLFKAAHMKPSCTTPWKLLGDACTLLFTVPSSIATFSIPAMLLEREIEDIELRVEVDKLQILQLGARCYGLSINMKKDDSNLWHDLGVNTYFQGLVVDSNGGKEDEVKDLLLRAIRSLKKSLELDPSNTRLYNSLGVVAAHNAVGEYQLAQHSILKAIECQPTALNWTHLGALYLSHNDPQLAHEAFSQAQAIDPSFVTCWVGQAHPLELNSEEEQEKRPNCHTQPQTFTGRENLGDALALVAESIDHSDFYDLFRHTTILGIQLESCIGYGHHVTRLACNPELQGNQRVMQLVRQSLPGAVDSLVHYTREKEHDAVGLNMAGLTLEMMRLYHSAAKAYQMALSAIGDGNEAEIVKVRDGIHCNLGRTLTVLGQVEDAMAHYAAIKEPDYFSHCGLALASLKAGKFEEAYNGYTSALHWLAPDDTQKSHIFVALASLQYKFQNPDEAKKLLFQGSQLQGASVHGLLALAALGLISEDAVLTNAALAELTPYEHDSKHLHHIAFLRAAEATSNGNMKAAKLILCRIIHKYPSSVPVWRTLARHLLTMPASDGRFNQNGRAASACASAATKLAQASGENKTIAQDAVISVMATLSTREKKTVKDEKPLCSSLLQAQKAVILCPGSSEAWAMLIAAKLAIDQSQVQADICKLADIWSNHASLRLSTWLRTLSEQKDKHIQL